MSSIKAVVFDLYGTLVSIRRRTLHKAVPRLLGVEGLQWVALIRDQLLVRPFADQESFVHFVHERLAPGRADVEGRMLELLRTELASVELHNGVVPLLNFLRRRGYKLGLLSNVSSVHTEPLARFGLDGLFDAKGLSCDAGACKPEPRFYLDLCARLGVPPAETLVVGDSLANDVAAPRALGMKSVRVGTDEASGLGETARLGFLSLGPDSEMAPLLSDGDRVALGGGPPGTLRDLRLLPDGQQGHYNLVARARLEGDDGSTQPVYCKRYLFPEGAHVEEFAHEFLTALGLPCCQVAITAGPEPCLVASEAPGTKMEGPAASSAVAEQVGSQAAVAYLFANADLRPRNGFVSEGPGGTVITMIDLEHCFFNLALDVEGLDDPLQPETFDRLGAAELQKRLKRSVLTPRTMKRARRAFFGTDTLPAPLEQAFREGWMATYRRLQAQGDHARRLLDARVHRRPYLIIGTQAYRRAMAQVDVDEIVRRLGEDAAEIYEASFVRAPSEKSGT